MARRCKHKGEALPQKLDQKRGIGFFYKRCHKRSFRYHLFCFLYGIALVCLIVSLLAEILTSASLTALTRLASHGTGAVISGRISHWYKPEIAAEIVKIIGMASILVTWIYSHLDDRNLGVANREILQWRYPDYHMLVLVHILMVILCYWSSKNNHRELSLLSLAVILEGMIMHWNVLNSLIFNRERGEAFALMYFEEKISRMEQTGEQGSVKEAVRLAEEMFLQIENANYEQERLARNVAKLMEFIAANGKNTEEKIRGLATVWEKGSSGKTVEASLIAIRTVLYELKIIHDRSDKEKSKANETDIYLALFVSLYKKRVQAGTGIEETIPEIFRQLLRDVFEIEKELGRELSVYASSARERHILFTAYAVCAAFQLLSGPAAAGELVIEMRERYTSSVIQQEMKYKESYRVMLGLIYDQNNVNENFPAISGVLNLLGRAETGCIHDRVSEAVTKSSSGQNKDVN